MNTTSEKNITTLNDLIETCKDGSAGFRDAAKNVRSSELMSLFANLAEERERFASEFQGLVGTEGGMPETTGSVAGRLHRGWIGLKSAITSQDEHAILGECERGEDSAVAVYKEALANGELAPNVRGFVQTQFIAVQSAHDLVRDLRDATKE